VLLAGDFSSNGSRAQIRAVDGRVRRFARCYSRILRIFANTFLVLPTSIRVSMSKSRTRNRRDERGIHDIAISNITPQRTADDPFFVPTPTIADVT
jgi:hypothetical protein